MQKKYLRVWQLSVLAVPPSPVGIPFHFPNNKVSVLSKQRYVLLSPELVLVLKAPLPTPTPHPHTTARMLVGWVPGLRRSGAGGPSRC